jgi:hypothetical protein
LAIDAAYRTPAAQKIDFNFGLPNQQHQELHDYETPQNMLLFDDEYFELSRENLEYFKSEKAS